MTIFSVFLRKNKPLTHARKCRVLECSDESIEKGSCENEDHQNPDCSHCQKKTDTRFYETFAKPTYYKTVYCEGCHAMNELYGWWNKNDDLKEKFYYIWSESIKNHGIDWFEKARDKWISKAEKYKKKVLQEIRTQDERMKQKIERW